MEKKRTRVPIGMPIAAAVCLALGLVALPIVDNLDDQQISRNVILAAIPFILIFVSILLLFMTAIWLAAARLNDRISGALYEPIERLIIGGILLGVFFMFQPWLFLLFKPGFFILLFSTLSFIAWSHIRPKTEDLDAEAGT